MESERQTSALPALAGLRILVTRPAHQGAALSQRLAEHGAQPVELPVIEIVPVAPDELPAIIPDMASYDWIIFTSVNTVTTLEPLLTSSGNLPLIATIGDATAAALEQIGVTVDLVPAEFVAESVLDALFERGVSGKRFLLPRAEVARTTLPDGLRRSGATVDVVPVYQTRLPERVDPATLAMVTAGHIDIVTFTSPSTVHNLLTLTGGTLPESTVVACIGPVTAAAARSAGLSVNLTADTYSIPGLVDALVHWRKTHD